MMNLHGLLQELGILAESARKVKSTEGVFELSSQFQKVLDTFVKSNVVNIADRLLGLQHALQLYGDLLPQLPSGGDVEKWGHGLFMTSARLVLGPDFSTLKQNDIPVNSFKSTLTVLYSRLQNNAVGHYFLVLQWLLVHLWNHPTLVAMMKGEDIERQRALTYLRSGEYPELIRLRVDMLAEGGLEMYALNLCSWCVQSPIFADDTSVRLNQLLLLHKLGKQEEFHNQCWQVPCCQGVQILEELNKRPDKDSKQAVNLMLAQTFLLQDWMKPAKFCCTQKLLDLWLQIQRKVEPDTGQFLQSISKVAQLAQSSRQLNKMAVTLNAQYGKEFLQLCTELCLAALRIDKKKLDSVHGHKQSVDMDQAVEGLVHTSLLLAKVYEGHPEIQMGAYLSALYLEPSVETYLKSVALKESTPVKSEIICPFNVHPNTLMETLQLLNSLRPSTLNPNADSQVFKDQCLKVMSHAGLTVPVAPHGLMENPLADIPSTSSQDKKFKTDMCSPCIRIPVVPSDVTQKGKGEVPNIATSSATYTSDSVVLQAADTLQALAHQIVSKAATQPPVPVISSNPPNPVQGAPATNTDPLAHQAYPWNASQSANANPVPFSFQSNSSGENLPSLDAIQSVSEPGKDTHTSVLSPVGKKTTSQNMSSNAGKSHMMSFSIADASKPGVHELQSASASLAKMSGMIPGGSQLHQQNMPTMLGENSERNTDIIAQAFLQSGLMPSSQASGSDSPSQTNDSPKKTRTKAAIVRALREKATTPNKELMAANVEGENSPVPMVPIPSSQFPPWHGPSNSGPRSSAAGECSATTSTASEIESMTPEAVAQILSMIANSHHSHYGQQQQQCIQVSKASVSPDAGAKSTQVLPPVSAPGRRLSAPPWGTPASQCPQKMGASPDGPISSFPNIVNALLTENVLKMTEEDGTEKKKRRRKKKKSVSESCERADDLDLSQSHFEKPILDGQNIQQDSSTGNPKPLQPSASDLPPIHSVLFSSLPSTNVLASNPAGGLPPMSGFLSSPDGNNDLVPNWSQFSVLPPKDHSVLCHDSGEGTEQKPPTEVEAFRCSYCSKSFDSMVQKMRHEEWMCSVKDAKGPQQPSEMPDGVPKKKKRRKKKRDSTTSSDSVLDTSAGKSLIAVPSQEAVDNLIAEPLKKAKKTKLYKCYFCTAVFESRHHLNKHREKCRTETKLDNPYVCQFCDLEFPSMPSLNGHLLSKHRGGLAEADPTLLTQKISVKDVMMLKVVKFMCCCCVNLFDNYKQWQDHKVECLPEAECDRYNEFQCIFCDAAFESRNRCYTHCKSKCKLYQEHGSHGSQKTWRCKLCKQVFNSYGSLNGHLLSRHTKYGKEYIEDIKKEDSKGNETETAAINIENSMFVDKSGEFGSADAGTMLDETATATETIGSVGGTETSTGEFVGSFANSELYAGQEVVVSAHEQVATTGVDPIDGTDLTEVPTVDSVVIEDNNIECTTVLEGSIISLNEDDPVPTAACGVEITTSASEEEPSDFSVSRTMKEDTCTSGHGCDSAEGCDTSGASQNAVIETEEKKEIPAMAVEDSAGNKGEAVVVEKVEQSYVSGGAVPVVTAVETVTREVEERLGDNLPVKVEAMEADTSMHKCSHCQLVFLTESLKTNHELYSCFVAPDKKKAIESNAKTQQVTLSAAVPCTISELVSCKAASANNEPSVAGSVTSGRPLTPGCMSYHEGQSGSSEASSEAAAQSVIEQTVTVCEEKPVASSELVVPNISSQEHCEMDNTHLEQPGSKPVGSTPSHVNVAGTVDAVQPEMKPESCAALTRNDGNQPEIQNNNSEKVGGRPLQSDLLPVNETSGILDQERGQSGAVFPNNLDNSGKELRKKHIRTAKDAALVKIITAEDSVDDICKADLAAHKKVPFTKTSKGAPAKPICKPRDYDESGRDGDGPGGGGLVCQYCNYNRAFEKQFSLLCHQKWVHGITDPSVQSERTLKNAAGKCQHSCTCCQHTPMKAVDMNGKYCTHPQHIASCDHPEASCKHLSVKLQRLNVNQYIHSQMKNQPVQDSNNEEQHGEPDIKYHSSLLSIPEETGEMQMHTISRGRDENKFGVSSCAIELIKSSQEAEFVGESLPSKRTGQNVSHEVPAGPLTPDNRRTKRIHSDPESTSYTLIQALNDEDKKKGKKMRTDLNKNETYDTIKTSLSEMSLSKQDREDSNKTQTVQRKTKTAAELCDRESIEPSRVVCSNTASSPMEVSRCVESILTRDSRNENVLKLDQGSGSEFLASVPVCPDEDSSKFTKNDPAEEQANPRRTLLKRTRKPRVEQRANKQRARLMQKAKRLESGQDGRLKTTQPDVAPASPVKKVVTRASLASRSSKVIRPASPEKVRALNKITNGIIARHRKMKKGQLVRKVKGRCKNKV